MAASAAARPAPLLAVSLVAVAAAGRRRLLTACAIGLLAGWWRPASPPPKPALPVSLTGTLALAWRPTEDGWMGTLRVQHYRQGRKAAPWHERVTLLVPGATPPLDGRRLRARGLLRRAPALANRPPLNTGPWRMRVKSRLFLEIRPARRRDLLWHLGLSVRRRIEGALADADSRPGVRLARALALGDSSQLLPGWRRSLRAAGLAHLVALSGLHIGLLVGCCLLAGAVLPRGAGPVLGVCAAVVFLLVAGPRPALVRATWMGLLAASALALGRRPHGLTLLAVLAALLGLAEPRLLADVGFRLTCSATAGILWLSPRFEASWIGLQPWLRRSLAVTCGAQIASLPWSLPAFRLLSPLAPWWNLVAVPWTALALAGSLAWAALALVWPAAAVKTAVALDPLTWPFSSLAALPPGITRPQPLVVPAWGAVLLAVGVAAVLLRPRRRWPWAVAVLALLWLRGPAPMAPEVRMLDVGQGEAVLLRDGPAAVLVDGGGWRYGDFGGRVLLPTLAAIGVRRLDAVVLTHPDLDHCHGLVDLLSYLPVSEVWTAPGWRSSPCASALLTAAGPRLRLLWAGERSVVGRWHFLALHPEPGGRGRRNDRSLVLAASAPGLRVLLTGDIEAAGERRLLRRWPRSVLRADLLKVPHHGSQSSTTAALLAAVRPRLALISCGRGNHYGHPASPVLARIAAAGARTLRTDRSGEIVLRPAAGGRWRLETPGAPRPD